jgi:hypothetical protein
VLLAAASAVGVVAGCVLVATQALVLADRSGFNPTYREVGDVVSLVGAVALAAAFGVSWAGFVLGARESRARMLAVAAGLFAAYGASQAVEPVLELVNAPSGAPWKFTATDAAFAAHGVALLVAAALVVRAVLSGSPGWLLGWASLLVAAYFALIAAAYGFELAETYDLLSPAGRVVGGLVAIGTGYFVAAIAAFKAAIALATADSRREWDLGVSATVFAAGFLTTTAGFITLATLGGGALICLYASFPFVLAAAAGFGAAAFFSTREAPQF